MSNDYDLSSLQWESLDNPTAQESNSIDFGSLQWESMNGSGAGTEELNQAKQERFAKESALAGNKTTRERQAINDVDEMLDYAQAAQTRIRERTFGQKVGDFVEEGIDNFVPFMGDFSESLDREALDIYTMSQDPMNPEYREYANKTMEEIRDELKYQKYVDYGLTAASVATIPFSGGTSLAARAALAGGKWAGRAAAVGLGAASGAATNVAAEEAKALIRDEQDRDWSDRGSEALSGAAMGAIGAGVGEVAQSGIDKVTDVFRNRSQAAIDSYGSEVADRAARSAETYGKAKYASDLEKYDLDKREYDIAKANHDEAVISAKAANDLSELGRQEQALRGVQGLVGRGSSQYLASEEAMTESIDVLKREADILRKEERRLFDEQQAAALKLKQDEEKLKNDLLKGATGKSDSTSSGVDTGFGTGESTPEGAVTDLGSRITLNELGLGESHRPTTYYRVKNRDPKFVEDVRKRPEYASMPEDEFRDILPDIYQAEVFDPAKTAAWFRKNTQRTRQNELKQQGYTSSTALGQVDPDMVGDVPDGVDAANSGIEFKSGIPSASYLAKNPERMNRELDNLDQDISLARKNSKQMTNDLLKKKEKLYNDIRAVKGGAQFLDDRDGVRVMNTLKMDSRVINPNGSPASDSQFVNAIANDEYFNRFNQNFKSLPVKQRNLARQQTVSAILKNVATTNASGESVTNAIRKQMEIHHKFFDELAPKHKKFLNMLLETADKVDIGSAPSKPVKPVQRYKRSETVFSGTKDETMSPEARQALERTSSRAGTAAGDAVMDAIGVSTTGAPVASIARSGIVEAARATIANIGKAIVSGEKRDDYIFRALNKIHKEKDPRKAQGMFYNLAEKVNASSPVALGAATSAVYSEDTE